MGDASATARKCGQQDRRRHLRPEERRRANERDVGAERGRAPGGGNRGAGRFPSGARDHQLPRRHRIAGRSQNALRFRRRPAAPPRRSCRARRRRRDLRRIQRSTLPRMAVASTSPSANGVGIGGKTAASVIEPTGYHADGWIRIAGKRKKPEAGWSRLRQSSCAESPGLMDPGTPHGLRTAPVLVQDRPQRLVEVFAVAEERLAQDAFLHRADLAQRAVAATVRDRRPGLEPVRADRCRTRSRRPSSRRP